jgi:predicted enzyme related to lactoylglutathione lyase
MQAVTNLHPVLSTHPSTEITGYGWLIGNPSVFMFTVESVDDTVARLRANGAELVGEVAQYEDKYRLCYMRGPAGIIVTLAEELF